jgi:hypothetical protein
MGTRQFTSHPLTGGRMLLREATEIKPSISGLVSQPSRLCRLCHAAIRSGVCD